MTNLTNSSSTTGNTHAHPSLTADEQAVVEAYHRLYYEKSLWNTTAWMGHPCLKCPTDTWVYQEILFETRPTLVIETGTAWGGSADYLGTVFDAMARRDGHEGRVITIDTVTRAAETDHPRVTKVKASSIEPETVEAVRAHIRSDDRVMIILDSLHNAAHVLAELRAYAPLVTPGCYAIVEDSNINGHPVYTDFEPDMGPGPFEAVGEYLAECDDFEVDRGREKLLMTLNPGGYLRRKG